MADEFTAAERAAFQYVAAAFRAAMQAQGVNQLYLVEKTGLTPRTISLLLSGRQNFKLSSLSAIADVLGLELVVRPKALPEADTSEPATETPTATTVLPLAEYPPGARVLEYIVRRQGGTMRPVLARMQWDLVKARLMELGFESTVQEALESNNGGLDTLPRGDVLDAWAMVTVGRRWPIGADGEDALVKFLQAWGACLKAQGALRLPDEPQNSKVAA